LLRLQAEAGNKAVTAAVLDSSILQRCSGSGGPCQCGCDEQRPAVATMQRQPERPLVLPKTPPRPSPESQFAFSHEGQVASGHDPGQALGEADEFMLWNFLVGDTRVRSGHRAVMDGVAKRWAGELKANPLLRIRLIGNASASGGSGINEPLARRRAEAVRDMLVAAGVPASRIEITGSGSRKQLAKAADPASAARNRRVEVSLFHETKVVSSLPGVSVSIEELALTPGTSSNPTVDPALNAFFDRLGATSVRAKVKLSGGADVEVAFLQLLTDDRRRADYVGRGGRTASLDYSHCMGDFLPCRDVERARLPFSLEGAGRVARPSAASTEITFNDAPGVVFPVHEVLPALGKADIAGATWSMSFVVILAARRGAELLPLFHVDWRLDASYAFSPPGSSSVSNAASVRELRRANGPPPGIDIEAAMSFPTCRLRARTIDVPTNQEQARRVCRPTVI
jgi:outer membrane protein OmpA-like peptidoglycan-associated protein